MMMNIHGIIIINIINLFLNHQLHVHQFRIDIIYILLQQQLLLLLLKMSLQMIIDNEILNRDRDITEMKQ
jgi:hypothetical protein